MKSNKIAFKVLRILCIVFIIFTIINLINNLINPDKELNILGFEFLISEYKSENPKISKGDLIITKSCSDKSLEKGDVIVYNISNSLLIREISDINKSDSGNIYSTKEVDSDSEDAWKINMGVIEGKYLFRIYKLGYIFIILKNKVFAIILTISLILLYIYKTQIEKNQKHRKINDKRKKGN